MCGDYGHFGSGKLIASLPIKIDKFFDLLLTNGMIEGSAGNIDQDFRSGRKSRIVDMFNDVMNEFFFRDLPGPYFEDKSLFFVDRISVTHPLLPLSTGAPIAFIFNDRTASP